MTTKEIMQYSLGLSMFISYITGGFTAYGYEQNDIISNTHQIQIRQEAGIEGEKIGNIDKGEIGEIIDGPIKIDNRTWIKVQYNNGISGWVHDKLISTDLYNTSLGFYNNYLKTEKVENFVVTQTEEEAILFDIFEFISTSTGSENSGSLIQSIAPEKSTNSEKIDFRKLPMVTTRFLQERQETVFPTYTPRTKEVSDSGPIGMVAKIITRFLQERQETVFPTYTPRTSESTDTEQKSFVAKVVSTFDSGIKNISFGIQRNNK